MSPSRIHSPRLLKIISGLESSRNVLPARLNWRRPVQHRSITGAKYDVDSHQARKYDGLALAGGHSVADRYQHDRFPFHHDRARQRDATIGRGEEPHPDSGRGASGIEVCARVTTPGQRVQTEPS